MDRIKEHRGNPTVDILLQQSCFNEQTPPRKLRAAFVPHEGAFETFIGGSGI
jgi:hypothetical protein